MSDDELVQLPEWYSMTEAQLKQEDMFFHLRCLESFRRGLITALDRRAQTEEK